MVAGIFNCERKRGQQERYYERAMRERERERKGAGRETLADVHVCPHMLRQYPGVY